MEVRVISWNIQGGGGTRIARIVDALAQCSPDVVVLSETTEKRLGELRASLARAGMTQQLSSGPVEHEYGVLVAAREPLTPVLLPIPSVAPKRYMCASVNGLTLFAIHAPSFFDRAPLNGAQAPFWAWILENASTLIDQRTLIVGDLNTDRSPSTLPGSQHLDLLLAGGWIDAVRAGSNGEAPFSYWNRHGEIISRFLIDHALASPSLVANARVMVSHGGTQLMRDPAIPNSGLSDHAALIVDV